MQKLSPVQQQQVSQSKMMRFQMEEAQWLDSIVRPLIPNFWKRLVEANSGNRVGRILHFLTDVVYIDRVLGIKISRSQDTDVLGGKGFRPGMDHGYKIARVHTTVHRRKKVFAEKTFNVDILIKNNL